MIGLFIQLAISWLLLWFFDKSNLSALGFNPTKERLLHFIFGFLIAALCFTIYCLTTTYLTNSHWALNGEYTAWDFMASLWWTINSVLFEELIFRGALLYILIKKIGIKKACLISSMAFGIYHWFSFGVLGNPIQMIYVFFSTGLWGFMYAFSFTKTKSLYLPIGLHLGWNLFNIVIFSQGPLGKQLLIHDANGHLLNGLPSIALTLFQLIALPVLVYMYLKRKGNTKTMNS